MENNTKSVVENEEAKETPVKSYSYYSNLLRRPFESVASLEAAEKTYRDSQTKEEKISNERKGKAKEIEEAYRHLINVKKEYDAKLVEANNKYLALRNEFVKKYGSFHMTITDYENEDKNNYFNNYTLENAAMGLFESILNW